MPRLPKLRNDLPFRLLAQAIIDYDLWHPVIDDPDEAMEVSADNWRGFVDMANGLLYLLDEIAAESQTSTSTGEKRTPNAKD